MKKGKAHIGTSGWNYKPWKGTFYPAGLPAKDEFAYFAGKFSTVELNNPFYRLPSAETFAHWKKSAPPGFLFSVKAPRFITHMKKLKSDHNGIHEFLAHAGELKRKTGPLLFQLPPRWKVNTERLEEFLQHLPPRHRYTFEFRDPTWFRQEVYDLLKRFNCALCIYHLAGYQSPVELTADFVYLRLHGPGGKYQGSYSDKILQDWAARCKQWMKKGMDVFVYFDNDQDGYAAANALRLKELVG